MESFMFQNKRTLASLKVFYFGTHLIYLASKECYLLTRLDSHWRSFYDVIECSEEGQVNGLVVLEMEWLGAKLGKWAFEQWRGNLKKARKE